MIDDTPHWEVVDNDDVVYIEPLDIDAHHTELDGHDHDITDPEVHFMPAVGVPEDAEPHHEIEHHEPELLHDLDVHHDLHESMHLTPALHRDHRYYEPAHHDIHEAPHHAGAHAAEHHEDVHPVFDSHHEEPHSLFHHSEPKHQTHHDHTEHEAFAEKIEAVDRIVHREYIEGEHLCKSTHFCHSFSNFAKPSHANPLHYSHMVATYFVVPDSLVVHEDSIHAKLHLHVHEMYNAIDYRANHLDLNLALF